jgi:hypothetical protein
VDIIYHQASGWFLTNNKYGCLALPRQVGQHLSFAILYIEDQVTTLSDEQIPGNPLGIHGLYTQEHQKHTGNRTTKHPAEQTERNLPQNLIYRVFGLCLKGGSRDSPP